MSPALKEPTSRVASMPLIAVGTATAVGAGTAADSTTLPATTYAPCRTLSASVVSLVSVVNRWSCMPSSMVVVSRVSMLTECLYCFHRSPIPHC